ncbi:MULTISPECIES: hypothetical protein [unclassified Paenarthrobacter]|uniref:hypothetical protein n=1 Tax=unclassified Paenarthrobacter TaxID=2634190 RepID=UPI003CEF8D98
MASRSRGHIIGTALAPVLMVLLTACLPPTSAPDVPSPDPAPAATTAAPTTQPPAVVPTAVQPPGPAGPGAPPVEAPVVQWVPLGPVGPSDPTSGQRYLQLQQFQCDELAQSLQGQEGVQVWVAGAAVCKALRTGSQDDWQRAAAAVAATPRVPQTQCLEYTVAAASASLLAQHRSNPGVPLRAVTAPGQACPRILSGLTVVDENLRPVAGLTRASGPREGGTIVRLDGYYVRVEDILFDGAPAFPEKVAGFGDYETLYLRMPPAEGRSSVRISITDTVDVAGTVTFYYEDAPGPSASAGPTGTPAPQPSTSSSPAVAPSASATATATP